MLEARRPGVAAAAVVTAALAALLSALTLRWAWRPGALGQVGTVTSSLFIAVVCVAVVVAATRRGGGVVGARGIGLIACVATMGVVRTLVYDPFLDPGCVGLCVHNTLVVSASNQWADLLGFGQAAIALVIGVWCVAVGFAHRSEWDRHDFDLAEGVLSMTASAALSVIAVATLLAGPARPNDAGWFAVTWWLAVGALAAAASVLGMVGSIVVRRRLGALARALRGESDIERLEARLRQVFDDDRLEVGYWIEGSGYVDADGHPLEPDHHRSRVELAAQGHPLAVVLHGGRPVDSATIERQLGLHALLAMHNRSLELALTRRIAEVASSRRRIVQAADAERRRIERDLHDGAQQQVLALSFELRRGERRAVATHDDAMASRFREATACVLAAHEQLRSLAHGVHPAMLSRSGLGAALDDLRHGRHGGFRLDTQIDARPDPVVESVLYQCALQWATVAPAGDRSVKVTQTGGRLVLEMTPAGVLDELQLDLAASVGGTLECNSDLVKVMVPCE